MGIGIAFFKLTVKRLILDLQALIPMHFDLGKRRKAVKSFCAPN